MIPSQRDRVILGLLQERGVITVADVCTHCDCSAVTARRDLERLERQGLLTRTHGGAVQATGQRTRRLGPDGRLVQEVRSALIDRCDVLIVTPTQSAGMRLLLQRAQRAGIPVIAESFACDGAVTTVAIDDYRAGVELGRWVGERAARRVSGAVQVLDVSSKLPNCEARSRGFADGLRALLPEARVVLRVDGEGLRRRAYQIALDAFAVYPGINVIFGINDDSALAALDAYRATGRDESQLLAVSFGLEGDRSRDELARDGSFQASVAMFPELVGRACVDAAICAYHRCPLPEHIVTPHAVVTPDSLERYYQKDHRTGQWTINWPVVTQLSSASPAYRLLRECLHRPMPRCLGQVVVFGEHDWYRNLQRAARDYGRSLGIALEAVDASQDAQQEIDMLKRTIGRTAASFVKQGDTIILDAGQTCSYLAQHLHGQQDVTIITNSVPVLAELGDEPGITLVSTGGTLRRSTLALLGPGAEATLSELRADKAFVGGTGLSLSFGLSNTNIGEAAVKLMMLRAAREAILLADHTKIGVESLVKVAPLESIHRLITDPGISPRDRLALTQRGIEVTIAEDWTD